MVLNLHESNPGYAWLEPSHGSPPSKTRETANFEGGVPWEASDMPFAIDVFLKKIRHQKEMGDHWRELTQQVDTRWLELLTKVPSHSTWTQLWVFSILFTLESIYYVLIIFFVLLISLALPIILFCCLILLL